MSPVTIRSEIRRLTRSGDSRVICPVTVESVEELTPQFSRVVVRGDGLAAYRTIRPADAFKLMIPPDGIGSVRMPKLGPNGAPVWAADRPLPLTRAFTVRSFDPVTLRLTFDVAVHGEGPAMTWLANTRPGDTPILFGTRREFSAGDGVANHLLIGDPTSLPAIASIVESLDAPATVFLQVESEADQRLVPGDVQWIVGPPGIGPDSPLEKAVRSYPRLSGRTQAWLAAEAGVVRSLRQYLLKDLAIQRDDLHTVAYWIAGQTAEGRDAEQMRWYAKANEEGLDTTDPAVLQGLEFS
ncbi:siderophore-interacting protein [Kribbella italica]|nr:siderophore-interacting protein [Kribbella italica]